MPVKIQVSQTIDRPPGKVFHFFAREHVRNHPRWDPDMELKQITDGPIGVGTLIHRRNSRSGTSVEGSMEVVEFEPDRVFGMIIHDGPVEMHGRTTFEPEAGGRTTLTFHLELPGMDESMDKSPLTAAMERSTRNIKQLIESEL